MAERTTKDGDQAWATASGAMATTMRETGRTISDMVMASTRKKDSLTQDSGSWI